MTCSSSYSTWLRPRVLAGLLVAVLVWPAATTAEVREVVIVHTNDFHSAIDPVDAFWMEGSPKVGGAAHLKTMIDGIRESEGRQGNPVFLFDSGDMFTGMLARLSYGEVLMEMMITMGYDALGVGNHEFDYGLENFRKQMYRMPFPVLSANTFYRDSGRLFTQPHAIIERDGIRIGVIGIIGQDAASVVLPSFVEELEFRDPAPYVRASIEELEPLVDLIVVLAHQGKTGPMQTDQEADPEVWRDFEEDIALTSEVPGIDLFLAAHAHRGIDPPYVNPKTGTIIMQTFGFGTRLDIIRLEVDTESGEVVGHEGGLVIPFSADYAPDPEMARKMDAYKERFKAEIYTVVGKLETRLIRKYNRESSLGDFVADLIRETGDAEIGFTNAGGLRADLPPGEVCAAVPELGGDPRAHRRPGRRSARAGLHAGARHGAGFRSPCRVRSRPALRQPSGLARDRRRAGRSETHLSDGGDQLHGRGRRSVLDFRRYPVGGDRRSGHRRHGH